MEVTELSEPTYTVIVTHDQLKHDLNGAYEKFRKERKDFPKEEALKIFHKFYSLWFRKTPESMEESVRFALENLNVAEKDLTADKISGHYVIAQKQLLELMVMFRVLDLNKVRDPKTQMTYQQLINKLGEVLFYTEQSVRTYYHMKRAQTEEYDGEQNDDITIWRFERIDAEENTPYQNLLIYLEGQLHESCYRRYNDSIYEMRHLENGQFTYSWNEKMTIKEFVFQQTSKQINYAMWKNSTKNKSNIKDAIDYLTNCDSCEFPNLIKDRHVFSFRNGVYITRQKEKGENEKWKDYFYEYGTKPILSTDHVACKFFNTEFNNYPELSQDEWYKIPTPNLQKILDYQFEGHPQHNEICNWVYIMIGRMLYEVKELERWQILPYLLGIAGCGKSTICDLIKNIFESSDIGIIENNVEDKFGLAPICERYIFVAPEIKKGWSIDQALFQKIVSGEEVALARKNQTPIQLTWKLPGFMASNEPPGFIDSAGSISRRLLVIKFSRMVTSDVSDPDLVLKINQEMPLIIKKANNAYLSTVNTYGNRDLWDVLPDYFKETRDTLGQETNPVKNFLASGKFEFGEDCYEKLSEFKLVFKEYCKENNLGMHRWTPTLYEEAFAQEGYKHKCKIDIKRQTRKPWPRVNPAKETNTNWICGLAFKPEEEN